MIELVVPLSLMLLVITCIISVTVIFIRWTWHLAKSKNEQPGGVCLACAWGTQVIHALSSARACVCVCAWVQNQGRTVRLAWFFRKLRRGPSMNLAPIFLASIPAPSCAQVASSVWLQHRSHLDGARTLFAVWIVSCTETCCAELYDVFLLVTSMMEHVVCQQAWQRIRICMLIRFD